MFPLPQEEEAAAQEAATQEPAAEEQVVEPERRSLFIDLLLYIPNRIFDAGDLVRAGVSVGPGIGVDLTATKFLNASAMTKFSVGVGYQTLRRLPIEVATYAMLGAGPIKAMGDPGLSWHRSPGDIRAEVHVFLVGAHAAVEIFEVFDLVVGILGFDPMDDDF
jgi:hypothetical protein